MATGLTPENMRLMQEGFRDVIMRDLKTGERERLEDRIRRIFKDWAAALKE